MALVEVWGMVELGLLTPMLFRCFLLRFLLALPEDEWAEAECELMAIGKGDGAVVAAAAAARAAALGPFNASTRLKAKKLNIDNTNTFSL